MLINFVSAKHLHIRITELHNTVILKLTKTGKLDTITSVLIIYSCSETIKNKQQLVKVLHDTGEGVTRWHCFTLIGQKWKAWGTRALNGSWKHHIVVSSGTFHNSGER